MEREQEIYRSLLIELASVKNALDDNDLDGFYVNLEDLETVAKKAIDGRYE